MTLRILIAVTGEDTSLLHELMQELDGASCWGGWVHVEPLFALTAADAAAILAGDPVDLMFFDPGLDGSQGPETFRHFQASAPHVPVILLVDAAGRTLAERLVREGAQDFLTRQELECAPVAHAIRSAIERQRVLAAAWARSMTDALTGLLSREAFLMLAERDRVLAGRMGRRMMVVLAEPAGLEPAIQTLGRQRLDLALVEAADHLRALAPPAALAARTGERQFGLSIMDTDLEPVDRVLARLRVSLVERRLRPGAAVFDPAGPVSLEDLLERAALELESKPAGRHAAGPWDN